ncbi:unnamed protein product [Brachionus calyciflorus]|uniref:Uncharacterized protein n=1 Tax=Brachionus calyciflorus TaxID=104777 RepID=A0A814FWP4_9BILA|nr:unnamed protein product [Brachionus calyciflorus]
MSKESDKENNLFYKLKKKIQKRSCFEEIDDEIPLLKYKKKRIEEDDDVLVTMTSAALGSSNINISKIQNLQTKKNTTNNEYVLVKFDNNLYDVVNTSNVVHEEQLIINKFYEIMYNNKIMRGQILTKDIEEICLRQLKAITTSSKIEKSKNSKITSHVDQVNWEERVRKMQTIIEDKDTLLESKENKIKILEKEITLFQEKLDAAQNVLTPNDAEKMLCLAINTINSYGNRDVLQKLIFINNNKEEMEILCEKFPKIMLKSEDKLKLELDVLTAPTTSIAFRYIIRTLIDENELVNLKATDLEKKFPNEIGAGLEFLKKRKIDEKFNHLKTLRELKNDINKAVKNQKISNASEIPKTSKDSNSLVDSDLYDNESE